MEKQEYRMNIQDLSDLLSQEVGARASVSIDRHPDSDEDYLVLTVDIAKDLDSSEYRMKIMDELFEKFEQYMGVAEQYSFATRFRVS